ncbi:MAG TPA: cysteine dioxygenase family protein [Kutzneria sp.]
MILAIDLDVHPAIDQPLLRDLIQPERPLWTPSQLRNLTSTIATELTTPLLDVLRFEQHQRWWARLALTGGVEVWLLSWLPGQGTQPHDHGGAAGSFTVLKGLLTEDYRYPGGPIRSMRRALGEAVGFSGGRAHQVRNLGTAPAASVHAYSPPLLPTREYASLEDVK